MHQVAKCALGPALLCALAFGLMTAPACGDDDDACSARVPYEIIVSLDAESAPDLFAETSDAIEVFACTSETLIVMRRQDVSHLQRLGLFQFAFRSDEEAAFYGEGVFEEVSRRGRPVQWDFELCGVEDCYTWSLEVRGRMYGREGAGCVSDIGNGCIPYTAHEGGNYPESFEAFNFSTSLEHALISRDGVCREEALRAGFEGVR